MLVSKQQQRNEKLWSLFLPYKSKRIPCWSTAMVLTSGERWRPEPLPLILVFPETSLNCNRENRGRDTKVLEAGKQIKAKSGSAKRRDSPPLTWQHPQKTQEKADQALLGVGVKEEGCRVLEERLGLQVPPTPTASPHPCKETGDLVYGESRRDHHAYEDGALH